MNGSVRYIKLLGQLEIDFFHPYLSDCEDVWSSDLDFCHLLASLPCILHLLICWPGHHEEMVEELFFCLQKNWKMEEWWCNDFKFLVHSFHNYALLRYFVHWNFSESKLLLYHWKYITKALNCKNVFHKRLNNNILRVMSISLFHDVSWQERALPTW